MEYLLGALIGGGLIALVGWSWRRYGRRGVGPSLKDILIKHFHGASTDRVEVHSREFPYRVCVDAYECVQRWIAEHDPAFRLLGVPVSNNFMTKTTIGVLLSPTHDEYELRPTALEFEAFDVGEAAPHQSVKHALWLFQVERQNLAVLWTSETTHSGCGFQTKLAITFAHLRNDACKSLSQEFFRAVESAVQKAATYRGKILSLEASTDYRGTSGGITVHQLRTVNRDDVILPAPTVQLLERNIVRFIEQRSALAKLGMPTKKGVLLYGPPGTGKTHTIHYLIGAVPGHTTLLMTAEQVGMLEEYLTLARLLQPSIVVMEDVDLIGGERGHMDAGRESLLNRLLNEMDGLRADAEILFLLTTNRPESLEKALAARPGRVDQAIEFPLPDEIGRRKLIRLYVAGALISDEVIAQTAHITHGVSASFIKELMRRAIQFHLECRGNGAEIHILQNDVDQAIDELLFTGGSLNRTLLGAEGAAD